MTRNRKLISKRDITVELYMLDNGHGLLESVMMDPYHLIRLSMEIDPKTRRVVDADVQMQIHPYQACKHIENLGAKLLGMAIGKGVMKEVADRVGRSAGCIHLRELAMETVNFAATALVGHEQGFGLMDPGFNLQGPEKRFEQSKTILKDSCYSYTQENPTLKKDWRKE